MGNKGCNDIIRTEGGRCCEIIGSGLLCKQFGESVPNSLPALQSEQNGAMQASFQIHLVSEENEVSLEKTLERLRRFRTMNRHAEPLASPKLQPVVIVQEGCIEESAVLGDHTEFHGESSWIVRHPKTNAFGESSVAGSKKGPSVDF